MVGVTGQGISGMSKLFEKLGRPVVAIWAWLGALIFLFVESISSILAGRFRWGLFFSQMLEVGVRSQGVVILTGAFVGAVFAAQTYFQFSRLGMESAVGAVVSVSMCRELGPVLTGLMLSGRVGAAMSAELGTMKVTEQIDALRALAVHPTDYLVVPRMSALMVSMPLLVAEAIGFGILAGYLVAVVLLDVTGTYYVANLVLFTGSRDVMMGLIKGFFFALIIALISCHQGLNARDGAVGVGRATTAAVVLSSTTILVANFFLTMALNIVFPAGR